MFTKQSRPLIAEFLGAFLLASAVLQGFNPFLTLAVLVIVIGGISGAHVNPAVTLGLASIKKFPMEKVPAYWTVQVLGAVTAMVVTQLLSGRGVSLAYSLQSADMTMFVAEVLGTAVFVAGITLAISKKLDGIVLAAAVGGALMLGAIFGGGLNPAVALSFLDVSVVAMIGSLIGAVIGAHFGKELGKD